jgi:hypothetical protein
MKRFTLRLPDDLHAALQRAAQREYRSLHNQILIILEEYMRGYEIQVLEAVYPPPEGDLGTKGESVEELMIMDGDTNQRINLMDLPAQAFAIFGRRNRHFLRIMSWDPISEDSRQEFSVLAAAGYHIRRWG